MFLAIGIKEIQIQSNRNIIYDLFQFQEPKQISRHPEFSGKREAQDETTIQIRYTLTTNNTTKNCRF